MSATTMRPCPRPVFYLLGLALSEQGRSSAARAEFVQAERINDLQPVIKVAVRRATTAQPLSAAQGLSMLSEFD